MRISKKELFHLRVRTRSGMYLGVIENIVLDTDAQNVIQYEVKINWKLTKEPLLFFNKKSLFIHRDQVISLTNKEMIVDDATVPKKDMQILQKICPDMVDGISP